MVDLFRVELGGQGLDDSGDLQLAKRLLGYAGEELSQVHRVQHFGLSTVPPPGAHGVGLALRGMRDLVVALGLEHPDYRPRDGEAGSTTLYNMHGDLVRLVDAETHLSHRDQVRVTAPLTKIEGDLEVTGSTNFGGSGSPMAAPNILHWGLSGDGPSGYPVGFANTNNSYAVGDAGDSGSDVSFVSRVNGRSHWENGLVGDVTDGQETQNWHLKEVVGASWVGSIAGTILTVTELIEGTIAAGQQVIGIGVMPGQAIVELGTGTGGTGTYTLSVAQTLPSTRMVGESYHDRIVVHEERSPRYGWTEFGPAAGTYPFPAEQGHTLVRIRPDTGKDAVLVLGTSTYGFPGRTGAGFTAAYEGATGIARFSVGILNVQAGEFVFESNTTRFVTGLVFQQTRFTISNQGEVNAGFAVQRAATAIVTNNGQAALALMHDYVPGVDVLTTVGGSGLASQWNLVTSQLASVSGIAAGGSGGTPSVGSTIAVGAIQGDPGVTVADASPFTAGDFADILTDEAVYIERQITSIAGNTLTLAGGFEGNGSVGNAVWKRQTVNTTTGVGLGAISVRIDGSGAIAEALFVATPTLFTTNPAADPAHEPVTGSGVVGAALTLKMGAATVAVADPGATWDPPPAPVATTSNAAGGGATLQIGYENSTGTFDILGLQLDGRSLAPGIAELAKPHIINEGDSITAGNNTIDAQPAPRRPTFPPWPTYTNLPQYGGRDWAVDNIAVPGATVVSLMASAPTRLFPLLSSRAAANIVVIFAGTNDLEGGASPATVYANLQAYVGQCQALGAIVGIGTMISRVGLDSAKNAYNALIDAGGIEDFRIDFAGDARLGADGAYANPLYFLSDGIHPTDLGNQILAQIAGAKLATVVAGITTPRRTGLIISDLTSSGAAGHAQLVIRGDSNPLQELQFGYRTDQNVGFIQAARWGIVGEALILNPYGGNIVLGAGSDDGVHELQVVGSVNASTGYAAGGVAGVSGSFVAGVHTITVTDGLITGIA